MKKIAAIVACTGILSISSLYADTIPNNLYVGGGFNVDGVPSAYTTGVGMELKVGAHLDQILPRLGVEAEYTGSLTDPKNPNNHNINIQTLGGYVTYDIYFRNSPIFVRPRFGVVLPNLGDKINSRDARLSAGADVGINISKSVSAYIGYTNISEVIDNYTVGIEYNF